MKSKEIENKSCCPTASEVIAKYNKEKHKVSKIKRIWFYLTCWRPITKYELARRERAWLKVGFACLNNHAAIEKIVMNLNEIIVSLQEKGLLDGAQIKKEGKSKKINKNEENRGNMYA